MIEETISRIINRHMARILGNLEDSGVPVVTCEYVKSQLKWIRADLVAECDDIGNNYESDNEQ